MRTATARGQALPRAHALEQARERIDGPEGPVSFVLASPDLQQLRARLELAIEQALETLDRIDAETEDMEESDIREPSGDEEPSLASPEVHLGTIWCAGSDDDREEDNSDG